ncbi:hypothetical protein D5086_026376 [Populus alba]|uniref:Uncharacterized protein n=1 Tax=Populus alba TaxID=43335 RepID=A0ACC4B1R3_POPAL
MENDHDGALEDAREPLMLQNSSREEGSGSRCSSNNTGIAWMVYLSTFVAVAGSFEVGSCSGYSSPTQKAIREDLSLSIAEYSLFGSILTVGAMIGAITSGPIADYIGRKGAMRFSSTFCAAGWLAIYFAKGALALDIGRLATGYGMGALSFVLMVATGVSVAFIIGTLLRWRVLALTGLIPCLILHVGLFLIPESPRWLAKRGRENEFETTLQKLRGRAADISYEAIEIKDYIETLERLPKAKLLDLFQRRNLHSVLVNRIFSVCWNHNLCHPSGMGPIPWVIMSEIFPLNIKGVAGSLATLVNWFCAWAVSFTFNFLMSWSSYGTFILYAAINAMTIAFVALLVPETKGRTLEQIQAAIR